MVSRIYTDLVAFYPLLDPLADHEDEAAAYGGAIARALAATTAATGDQSKKPSLLEIGSGAGNNAYFFARDFEVTCADLSEEMLGLSRQKLPHVTHHCADMRTMALGKTFDAVFIHDAIAYMTTEADLRQAFATAYAHTRPGGVAAFAPDVFRDGFTEATDHYLCRDDARGLQGIEWMWDPDPSDTMMAVDFAFLLRDAEGVHTLTERHIEGLFPKAHWQEWLSAAGFEVTTAVRPLDLDDEDGDDESSPYAAEFFLCTKPL